MMRRNHIDLQRDELKQVIDSMLASLTKEKLVDAFKKAKKAYWAGRGEICNSSGSVTVASTALFGRGLLTFGIYNLYKAVKAKLRILDENKYDNHEVKAVLKQFLLSDGGSDILSLKYLVVSYLLNKKAADIRGIEKIRHYMPSDEELDRTARMMVQMVSEKLVNRARPANSPVPTLVETCVEYIMNNRLFTKDNKVSQNNLSRLPEELQRKVRFKMIKN